MPVHPLLLAQEIATPAVLEVLQEMYNRLPPPLNMVVLIVAIVFSWLLVATIAAEIRKFVGHRQELALKRELVDRSMHADEIETIITARRPEDPSDAD